MNDKKILKVIYKPWLLKIFFQINLEENSSNLYMTIWKTIPYILGCHLFK